MRERKDDCENQISLKIIKLIGQQLTFGISIFSRLNYDSLIKLEIKLDKLYSTEVFLNYLRKFKKL